MPYAYPLDSTEIFITDRIEGSVLLDLCDDCKDAASVEEILKGLSASDKIGGQQGTTAQYFIEGSDDWGFEGFPAEWVPYKSASLAVQDMINGNVKYVIIDAAPAASITKAINAMQ